MKRCYTRLQSFFKVHNLYSREIAVEDVKIKQQAAQM